jgi:hypothetical protein
VRNTYEHLLQLDIHDKALAEIVRRLDAVESGSDPHARRARPKPAH